MQGGRRRWVREAEDYEDSSGNNAVGNMGRRHESRCGCSGGRDEFTRRGQLGRGCKCELKPRSCLGVWSECQGHWPHVIEACANQTGKVWPSHSVAQSGSRGRTVVWPSVEGGDGDGRYQWDWPVHPSRVNWQARSRPRELYLSTVSECSECLQTGVRDGLLHGRQKLSRLSKAVSYISSPPFHSRTGQKDTWFWLRVIDGAGPTQPPTYCSWTAHRGRHITRCIPRAALHLLPFEPCT